MRLPLALTGESRTRLLQGIGLGIVATIFVGFYWGGWTLGGTAAKMADAARVEGQVSVLGPMCATQFAKLDGAMAKFKAARSSYGKETLVSEMLKQAGTEITGRVAEACAVILDKKDEKKS